MSSARLEAIRQLLDSTDVDEPNDGVVSAIAMAVGDTTLAGDEPSLNALVEFLQRNRGRWSLTDATGATAPAERGALLGILRVAETALDRLVPSSLISAIGPNSHAHRFLSLLAERSGLRNADISGALGVHETEVSRVGRRLADTGLARKQRVSTMNLWEITPRGKAALDAADEYATLSAIAEEQTGRSLARSEGEDETAADFVSRYIEALASRDDAVHVTTCLAKLVRLPSVTASHDHMNKIGDLLERFGKERSRQPEQREPRARQEAIIHAFPEASEAYGADSLDDITREAKARGSVLEMSGVN